MKIISCKIENYGKLSDKHFEFPENYNVFCQENGWGKSTLTSFMKVMFFGFDNETKRDDYENERKRYKPWQGGVYGGQLKFEANEKTYIITRKFGTKEKDDEFSIRNAETNLESNDYTSDIGEELFKIDRNSFSRTVYISQNDCETDTTDSINAKIGDLAENTDDINNFEKVDKKLQDLLNSMTPTRKTGSIAKAKTTIAQLREKVKDGINIDNSIQAISDKKTEQSNEYKRLETQREALIVKQQTVSEYKDIQSKKEKYDSLQEEYNKRKLKMEQTRAYFPGQLPIEDEINKNITDNMELYREQKSMDIYQLTETEQVKMQRLEQMFAESIPTIEEIESNTHKVKQLQEMRVGIAQNQMSADEENILRSYEKQFENGVPEENEINEKISSWSNRAEKKNTLNTKKASLETMKTFSQQIMNQNANSNIAEKKNMLPLVGIIVVIAGVLGMFINLIIGIIGIVAGVVLIILGISNKNIKATEASVQNEQQENDSLKDLQREIDEDESIIASTAQEVQKFFELYKIDYEEGNVSFQLGELKFNTKQYKTLIEKKKIIQEKNLGRVSKNLAEDIKSFLRKYYLTQELNEQNFADYIQELSVNINYFKELNQKRNNLNEAKKSSDKIFAQIKEYIKGLSLTLENDIGEQLLQIKEHFKEYNDNVKEYDNAKKATEEFEKKTDVEKLINLEQIDGMDSIEVLSMDITNIASEQKDIHENIVDYDRQLDELQSQRDDISEDEKILSVLEHDYEQDLKKYKILQRTKENLEQAKNSFTARYMGPITSSFKKYYDILTNEDASNYSLDAKTQLTIDEQGMQRKPKFLSRGYRDLIGICMRMALVDAMYQEEKPFVIFDDPFVNLDKEKTKGGIELLNKISEQYQVIYLTCHESRKYVDKNILD